MMRRSGSVGDLGGQPPRSTRPSVPAGRSDPDAGWELHPLKIYTFPRRTLAASPYVAS